MTIPVTKEVNLLTRGGIKVQSGEKTYVSHFKDDNTGKFGVFASSSISGDDANVLICGDLPFEARIQEVYVSINIADNDPLEFYLAMFYYSSENNSIYPNNPESLKIYPRISQNISATKNNRAEHNLLEMFNNTCLYKTASEVISSYLDNESKKKKYLKAGSLFWGAVLVHPSTAGNIETPSIKLVYNL